MDAYFEKILAPITVNEFFNQYHEKEILHIGRNDSDYYHTILKPSELSAFLDRQDVFYPSLRIVKNGKELPSAGYTLKGVPIGHHRRDGIIDTEKAFAHFNDGATLVVQAGQRYFQHLSKCCLRLSQKFNAPVQANIYITPDQSQGFNPHWDTHDVFVLQISGTKTWKLYGFEKELPTKNQSFVSKGYEKQPLQTLQLQPGDFLYLPRGYVHDAIADNGISAHITIGILSFTWARFFAETLVQLENEKSFREAVPFWNPDLPNLMQEKLQLLKASLDQMDLNAGLQKLNDQYQKIQPQPVNHYFESLLNISKIQTDTEFSRNEGVIFRQEVDGSQLKLHFLGKTIQMPVKYQPALDFVFSNSAFQLSAIPGEMTEQQKTDWVVQLIREGVVYMVNN